MGDIDGDHRTDYVVTGFPRYDGKQHMMTAVSSSNWKALWSYAVTSSSVYACAVGDVSRDGVHDLVLGEHGNPLRLLDGRTGHLLRQSNDSIESACAYYDVVPIGDVNGDGALELAVHLGHRQYESGVAEWRSERLIYEIVSGATGERLAEIHVPSVLLRKVFCPGDVDGNGRGDVAWDDGSNITVLDVLSSKAIASVQGSGCGGQDVDYDRDGCSDLVVAQNVRVRLGDSAPADLWRKGAVVIVSGRDGAVLRRFDEGIL
jgi:hypothetical protein